MLLVPLRRVSQVVRDPIQAVSESVNRLLLVLRELVKKFLLVENCLKTDNSSVHLLAKDLCLILVGLLVEAYRIVLRTIRETI